jgi:hypothetical protein
MVPGICTCGRPRATRPLAAPHRPWPRPPSRAPAPAQSCRNPRSAPPLRPSSRTRGSPLAWSGSMLRRGLGGTASKRAGKAWGGWGEAFRMREKWTTSARSQGAFSQVSTPFMPEQARDDEPRAPNREPTPTTACFCVHLTAHCAADCTRKAGAAKVRIRPQPHSGYPKTSIERSVRRASPVAPSGCRE